MNHVRTDLGLPTETADKVRDEASVALGLAIVGPAGEQPEVLTGETKEVERIGNGTTPVYIKDARAWKAGLVMSQGVRPVKDLEEFLEGGSKL